MELGREDIAKKAGKRSGNLMVGLLRDELLKMTSG